MNKKEKEALEFKNMYPLGIGICPNFAAPLCDEDLLCFININGNIDHIKLESKGFLRDDYSTYQVVNDKKYGVIIKEYYYEERELKATRKLKLDVINKKLVEILGEENE